MARGRPVPWAPLRHAEEPCPNARPLSTHQLLACVLAQWRAARVAGPSTELSDRDAFFASMPSAFPTVPLSWALDGDTQLLSALPPRAARLHDKVQARFEADWRRLDALDEATRASIWASVSRPGIPAVRPRKADVLWGWLCVNSRCVYVDLRYVRHEDNFTLAPLLDMANHTFVQGKQCKVRYSAEGMELCAPAQCGLQAGDEVCITYGPHTNATLLTEYGFLLAPRDALRGASAWDGNPHAELAVDDAIAERFRAEGDEGAWKVQRLKEEGYSGDYTMHPEPAPAHVSHRLLMALWLLSMAMENKHTTQRLSLRARAALQAKQGLRCVYSPKEAARQWKQVTYGMPDSRHERPMRDVLCRLCTEMAEQRSALLEQLQGRHDEPASLVRLLLEEERDIAHRVQTSAERGEAW
ncbi:unnamed protein product [Malassezia sympodialis ATCC 42132]|nr:uncharacterized protein MSY001_0780 [Malassezia sympodialis ATCC 42132]CCU98074.1 unnamed protein product [Malassezia sympodialis ATCC 42132]|eukprot:XP_018739396.1 uncharacterized protein MSY001_0780 [Malassezia sympodialis ATCC 42132]